MCFEWDTLLRWAQWTNDRTAASLDPPASARPTSETGSSAIASGASTLHARAAAATTACSRGTDVTRSAASISSTAARTTGEVST